MSIKTENELELFKKSLFITMKTHSNIEKKLQNTKITNTSQIQEIITKFLKKENINGYAFKPIIGYNRKIPDLHYYHNNDKLPNDCLILVDIGYKYKGYCSDVTRCYNIDNTIKKNIYTFSQNIQNYVYSIVKPGMTFNDIEDSYLNEYIQNLVNLEILNEDTYTVTTKNKIRSLFQPHSIGHSIHKVVHEPMSYNAKLKPNMIITIEPGIYFSDTIEQDLDTLNVDYDKKVLQDYKQYGGSRMEDMFLITKNGCSKINP